MRGKRKQPKTAGGRVGNAGKVARAVEVPEEAKKPRALHIDSDDYLKRRPVWRFEYLDAHHPKTAEDLAGATFCEVHTSLADYEKQTVKEIWHLHDNGCKRYDVDGAHANITNRLKELDREDETAVHTLRVRGAFRLYGILRENVFHLLWIDPDHEMWPSKLKNT